MLDETVGHYRLTEKLAQGGMGEVFRAQDVRLGRSVTLKFPAFERGPTPAAMERFQREARAASALNHPNICALYDVGEHHGRPYIVMEFLEGRTVEEVIGGRPLSTEQILDLGIQTTDALAAAHAKGILHRDIKPSNLFLTNAGHVKVLDFGLAKLTEDELWDHEGSSIPTREKGQLTSPGAAVGTVAYMSPEQVLGKALDGRSDIFSLGVVLYEMATGRRPFFGDTANATFDAILHRVPTAPVRLNPELPLELERILNRALEKDPALRYQGVSDLGSDLRRFRRDLGSDVAVSPPKPRRRLQPSWAVAVLASVAALWALLRPLPSPERSVTRFAVQLPADERLTSLELDDPALALSPDGSRLLYLAGRKLHLRPMDRMEATVIAGSEGAWSGFFSPDGEWIGFYNSTGKLMKVHSAGGTPMVLNDQAPDVWGASWGVNGTILFSPTNSSGLFRIPASGGSPEAVTTPDSSKGEISHRWPEILPDAKSALFTIWKGSFQASQIALLSLETGAHRVLLEGGSNPRFSPSGHLVYAREGELVAAAFEPGRGLVGPPVLVLEGVATQGWTGAAHFSLSHDGSLAYLPRGSAMRTLHWVDREGASRPLLENPRGYMAPRISPDGSRLALQIIDETPTHVWVYDLERGTMTRVSSGAHDSTPIWTPDGRRLTYGSGFDLDWQAADGSGPAETLTRGTHTLFPVSWSPDGRTLVFNAYDAASRGDIWLLSLEDGKTARPFLQTKAAELGGVLSPDGRWMAYLSDASGRFDVYLRAFPGPGGAIQVSTEGGTNPIWARSGREIFYRRENQLIAVNVDFDPELRLSKPRLLFEGPFLREEEGVVGFPQYDVAPDGDHFVMIRDDSSFPNVQVVLHWAEELNQKVPPSQAPH